MFLPRPRLPPVTNAILGDWVILINLSFVSIDKPHIPECCLNRRSLNWISETHVSLCVNAQIVGQALNEQARLDGPFNARTWDGRSKCICSITTVLFDFLWGRGINFTYFFDPKIYDQIIETESTQIILGRGLDIYYPPHPVMPNDQQFRRTRKCRIIYLQK
jgi:hypothetical protein